MSGHLFSACVALAVSSSAFALAPSAVRETAEGTEFTFSLGRDTRITGFKYKGDLGAFKSDWAFYHSWDFVLESKDIPVPFVQDISDYEQKGENEPFGCVLGPRKTTCNPLASGARTPRGVSTRRVGHLAGRLDRNRPRDVHRDLQGHPGHRQRVRLVRLAYERKVFKFDAPVSKTAREKAISSVSE